jgi:hypothetical protein
MTPASSQKSSGGAIEAKQQQSDYDDCSINL